MSDPEDIIQRSSTLWNSSALCDSKQRASSSSAPDHFLQNHEQKVELAIVQVDHKKGQSPRESSIMCLAISPKNADGNNINP